MSDRIRTFIAIEVSATPLGAVLNALSRMGRSVRTLGDPLHLTLKFLGDTEMGATTEIMREIDAVANEHTPFDLEVCGLGAFPRIERPSVVWAGVAAPEPVTTIAEDLALRLEPLGFPIESRPFHPHVTLARVKGRPPHELADLFDRFAETSFGTITVNELKFFQSRLTPAGPEYSVLNTARIPDER